MTASGRRSRSSRPAPSARARATPSPATPLPLGHPAWWVALAVTLGCVLLSVTYQIYEKDFWQHLAVGRAIWQTHQVPTTQVWTWPTYGAPDVNSSWGFRALVWPLWQWGGVWGLFAWRWLTTLAVFGLALATARRMGARGFTPLLVIVLCALTYRQRSQVRPETLASVWLALSVWLLESRRTARDRRFDRAWLMAPLLWAWVNSHISYPLGLVVLVAHMAARGRKRAAGASAEPRTGGRARTLWLATALGLGLGFLNPFGIGALTQPFEYFFAQRGEPIFRVIPELWPLDLRANLTNLLPAIVLGWPLLAAWRWRRGRVDVAEILIGAAFLSFALFSQRFIGFAMVVAAPYMARDLDEWVGSRRWPAWTSSAWGRAGLAMAACVLSGVVEWRRPELALGVGIRMKEYPVVACDVMAREGIRGHGFNPFFLGGYMLYRFWPDRSRLPFMDIHQAGTRADRDTYARTLVEPGAWRILDDRHRFDYALLRRQPYAGDPLLEVVDADSAFALVFMDDAAALYVRRDGPLGAVAERLAYREIPAGTARLGVLGALAMADPLRRRAILDELAREASESPFNALALGRLGSLELAIGDPGPARDHLLRALVADPRAARAHERLGTLALAAGDPRQAITELETERRLNGLLPAAEVQLGRAWQALGDRARARRHYAKALTLDPGNRAARDSLAAIGDP